MAGAEKRDPGALHAGAFTSTNRLHSTRAGSIVQRQTDWAAASRVLGHALTAGGSAWAWRSCAAVWAMRLDEVELGGLAASAAWACSAELGALVLDALDEPAGMPDPWPAAFTAEAETWAMFASRRERRAYLGASYRSLPAADRRAFVRRVSGDARTLDGSSAIA